MKGADDMIGLVLGAVLGSGLYGAEKSMQIAGRESVMLKLLRWSKKLTGWWK